MNDRKMRYVGKCEYCSSKKRQRLLLADTGDYLIPIRVIKEKVCRKCYDGGLGEGSFVEDWKSNCCEDGVTRIRSI